MRKLFFILSIAIVTGITFSCSKSEDSDPNPPGGTPGPKFLAAKSIINNSCALSGCHIAPTNNGGVNFGSDANIVSNGSRIKTQAVDQGTMPPSGPLSVSDKAIITNWINAGGKLTD
jgi:uncharacterized membrane protein